MWAPVCFSRTGPPVSRGAQPQTAGKQAKKKLNPARLAFGSQNLEARNPQSPQKCHFWSSLSKHFLAQCIGKKGFVQPASLDWPTLLSSGTLCGESAARQGNAGRLDPPRGNRVTSNSRKPRPPPRSAPGGGDSPPTQEEGGRVFIRGGGQSQTASPSVSTPRVSQPPGTFFEGLLK